MTEGELKLVNVQKFNRGDKVHIRKDMPRHMAHFDSDFQAVIMGSYFDLYGGSETRNQQRYAILRIADSNEIAWYEEDQLTLIGKVTENEIRELKLKRYND